jgi:tetratricopeptide (TPR) repeat protein
MNRKTYLITLIAIGVISVGLIVTNAIWYYLDWIWIFVIAMLGYMFIRYRVSGPIQLFSTKFNMMVDYDLDVEGAEAMAEKAFANAPTKGVGTLYQMYLGMAKYYNGKYEEAIRIFHMIELKRLNPVYHVLVFAYTAYAAFELNDMDEFNLSLGRIKDIQPRITARYRPFAASYVELLESFANIDVALDAYKEVIEKHFNRQDGYPSTQLIYHYRMAIYFERINDTLEMDKHLAYVIANGKNHHTALRAKEKFQNSVDVADYIQKDEINVDNEPDVFDQNQEEPLSIDTRDEDQSESDSNDDDSGDQE